MNTKAKDRWNILLYVCLGLIVLGLGVAYLSPWVVRFALSENEPKLSLLDHKTSIIGNTLAIIGGVLAVVAFFYRYVSIDMFHASTGSGARTDAQARVSLRCTFFSF